MDGPVVASDQITELFHGIATAEQRRELDLCGTIHFTYVTEHSGHFSVRAGMEGNDLSMSIRNLER